MANRKSPAAQAIKDMLELGIDVTFLTGHISEIHVLNAEISIITKSKVKRVKKESHIKRAYLPKAAPKPKHVYNHSITINIDGTVSMGYTEWDYE